MIKDGVIQIKYPTGEMDLIINRFFPATLERVKVVFRLMRDYSPPEDQQVVYRYLKEKLAEYEGKMEHYGQLVAVATGRLRMREASQGLRENRTKYKRTKRNIELMIKITGLEVGDE